MSTSNLPLIGLSAKCAEVSKIPEDVSDHLEVSAPHPELMYTPIDLELAEGVDVGKQAVRWRSRKRKAPRVRRKSKSNGCVDFFMAIWYVIKLVIWDIPCCFFMCGQACCGGDTRKEDQEDSEHDTHVYPKEDAMLSDTDLERLAQKLRSN